VVVVALVGLWAGVVAFVATNRTPLTELGADAWSALSDPWSAAPPDVVTVPSPSASVPSRPPATTQPGQPAQPAQPAPPSPAAPVPAPSRRAPAGGEATLGQRFGGFSMPLEQVQFLSTADIDRQADLLVELNGGWQRADYMWSRTEPSRGDFTWDDQDRWIKAAVARGIQPVPVLYFTPSWARPAGSSDKHVPTDLSDYGTWVGEACAHLWTIGVRHVELWNEQNLSGFFQPLSSDGDRDTYIAMAKDAAAKCKAATPEMFVLAGGLSTSDTVFQRHGGSPNGAFNTMAYYAEHGLYEYVDGQAWHPYLDDYQPGEDADGWPRWAPGAIAQALAILDSGAPGRNLQLWNTESSAPRSAMSADEQAQRAQLAYESFLPGGFAYPYRARLGPFFWFSLRNRSISGGGGSADRSREDSFGLVTADWSVRFPAFEAIQATLARPAANDP
jgi:polysaccharide biosynthesis protein PslG